MAFASPDTLLEMAATLQFLVGENTQLRCSKLFAPGALVDVGKMLGGDMLSDVLLAAELANGLKDFEPNMLGKVAEDLTLAPIFTVDWLKKVAFNWKSSFYYAPIHTGPPFVQEEGIYMGIQASRDKLAELEREWKDCLDEPQVCMRSAAKEGFKDRNPGAAKSLTAPLQWAYLLSMERFKNPYNPVNAGVYCPLDPDNLDLHSLFPPSDLDRVRRMVQQIIPSKGGALYSSFVEHVWKSKEFSFDDMDTLVKSEFFLIPRDVLSPYYTFWKQLADGETKQGWGIKCHDLQIAIPNWEKVPLLNPVFNPDAYTSVIDVVLWTGDVTSGEQAKIGFYYNDGGQKILNVVPAHPKSKTAVTEKDYELAHAIDIFDDTYEEMLVREYTPCHFQSDTVTMSNFVHTLHRLDD